MCESGRERVRDKIYRDREREREKNKKKTIYRIRER